MAPSDLTRTGVMQRSLGVSVDRAAIRDFLANIKNADTQDWCVACRAGKAAAPMEKLDWVQQSVKDVLQGKSLKEFVDGLKDVGAQAWCVACGAGKAANPLGAISDPAEISDELIDALAGRLINHIKIG